MKKGIGLLLLLSVLAVFSVRIYHRVVFKQNVSGYLKRAADANTIDLAREELTRAIDYLEANNLTSGYTSILWRTPDEDIEFWYRNLKASQRELEVLNSESALERTNVLIKLRETLVDNGEKTKVTVPEGLSVYPHNKLWAGLMLYALIALIFSIALLSPETDKAGISAEEVA